MDNLGFHIYRALAEDGPYSRITGGLIAGTGNSSTRHEYDFTDVNVISGVTYWYKLEDVAMDGRTTVHGPMAITYDRVLPGRYDLSVNVPNPFNPQTTIVYQLSEASEVRVTVYNMTGQIIQRLVAEHQEAGSYQVVWDGVDYSGNQVASGVYIYELSAGRLVKVQKMIRLGRLRLWLRI